MVGHRRALSSAGTPGPVARRVVVSGRVQGVFFRAACEERARRTGVAGWVRNTAAGAVEAWFEGSPAAVDALVTWCRSGPRGADVDGVEVYDEVPAAMAGFRIR